MASSHTLPLFPVEPAPVLPRTRAPRPAPAVPSPPGPVPQPRVKAVQLWLALHLPRLSLDCLRDGAAPAPIAIVDPEDRLQSVLACNAPAREAGVRPGHSLNAALALAANLLTWPRDATRERELLERIAAWCHRFTPLVSLAPPDELLLEVKGSLHLFGGAQQLMPRIAHELSERGIEVALAMAPTPRGALWLARSLPEKFPVVEHLEELARHLANLPLRCLRWPEEQFEKLTNMGLRQLSELLRLPRGGLARRLGLFCLEDLDRALGRRPEVRRRFRMPERFDERVASECDIETSEGIESLLAPSFEQLRRFLQVRGAALTALALELRHRQGAPTRIRVGLAAPSSDVRHLRGLLHERLAANELRAPVLALRLRSSVLLDAAPVSIRLSCALPTVLDGRGTPAAAPPQADALPRLLERLQARLGRAAVFGVSSFAEHRPECAWRSVDPASLGERLPSVPKALRQRPLWLLPEPEPLPALARDRHLREGWRFESGPERIESGWWDGNDVARDYFIARDARGVRSWVYCDRRAPRHWYRHGLFG